MGLVSVSREEVRRIAQLAALAVPDDDIDAIAEDLSSIVELIRQLEDAAGRDATPYRPGAVAAPLRDDRVVPPNLVRPPEEFAAEFADGFFLAPRPPGVGSDA